MTLADQIPTVTGDSMERLREINTKLRFELAQIRARRSGSYRLRREDVIEIGKAWRDFDNYHVEAGLRRLEDILEELDPRWREWT